MKHAAVARILRLGQIENVEASGRWVVLQVGGKAVANEQVEFAVAVIIEEGGRHRRAVVSNTSFICDINKLRLAGNRQHVLQQPILAVCEGQQQRLGAVVVMVDENRAAGEAIFFRMQIDFSQDRNVDPLKTKISQVAVKGVAIFRALQRIGQKNVRQ